MIKPSAEIQLCPKPIGYDRMISRIHDEASIDMGGERARAVLKTLRQTPSMMATPLSTRRGMSLVYFFSQE